MAYNKFLMIAIVALFLPTISMATTYMVGDSSGWTINFDYQAWAKDKVFYVGDKLVFQYPQGVHNVFKVNGTAFQNCTIPPANQALTSGNDTILLATPGRKWYICGVANHCSAYGQKLAITVQYSYGWAPAPAPSSIPTTPATPTEPWAPAPAPSSRWAPAPYPPSVPTTPATPAEPWAPAPAPSAPWEPPTEPWAPAPTPSAPWEPPTEPWAPAPAPSSPWAPAPSSPSVPSTPTKPWAPVPSPYPWY
ncbi:Plastocyanin-like protein [Corchorus capsularis]|uniref:Plastocyanin-like protein n=1 Tax=Corchorus capsularis TaxID=210143 RepID=A0A1R3HC64_COCAP|nr:Plastocyanin-like protein [Corchorus capsularis]